MLGGSVVTDGKWHHIAVVKHQSTLVVFVDGVLQNSISNTMSFTNNGFALGSDITGSTGFFNGYIDDVRVTSLARYTSTFTPIQMPIVALKTDQFGYSVASNDTFVIVGAPFNSFDNNGYNYVSGAGAMYSFYYTGVWKMVGKVCGATRSIGDNAGASLSVNDMNAAFIGIQNYKFDATAGNSVTGAGAVYTKFLVPDLIDNTPPVWVISKLPVAYTSYPNAISLVALAYNPGNITYSISPNNDGVFPQGLTLTSAGEITGLAQFLGQYSFTLRATDSAGKYSDQDFTIVVVTAPYDTNFSSVRALLHFNTSMTLDNAAFPGTWSLVGTPTISSTEYKFGGNSGLFSNGGLTTTNNYVVNFATATSWTIECWYYCTDASSTQVLFSTDASAGSVGNATRIMLSGGNIVVDTLPTPQYVGPAYSINQWHHIALVNNNGLTSLYQDEVLINAWITTPWTSQPNFTIGSQLSGANPFIGFIDDFRISGVARYIGKTYVEPQSQFADQ